MTRVFCCRSCMEFMADNTDKKKFRDFELKHLDHAFCTFDPDTENGWSQAIMSGVPYSIANMYKKENLAKEKSK